MTGAWGSGQYADPADPNNLDAWDTDGDGIVEANPSERQQRFYFPPPTMLDPNAGPRQTAEEVAGAIAKQSELESVRTTVRGQGAVITDLEAVQAAARATNMWVSPDIQDMSSFPYYLMHPIPVISAQPTGDFTWEAYSSSATDPAGGHSHTIAASGATDSVFVNSTPSSHAHMASVNGNTGFQPDHTHTIRMVNPTYAPASKTIELSVVPTDRFAYLDQLKFCSGRDPSLLAIQSMLASLYVLNPKNGHLEKFWASGELKGEYIKGQKMYAVDLTGGGAAYQQCVPGQLIFAALWQNSSGFLQGPRGLGCAYLPMYEVNTKSWLKTGAFTLPNQETLPSSIPFADLTPNYIRQFWAGITTG